MDDYFKIIGWLNCNQGFIMAVLTFVYVLATIIICVFNGLSAKAALKQLEAMEKERKRDAAKHRISFIANILYNSLYSLDATQMFKYFVGVQDLAKAQSIIYNFFDGANRTINIDMNLYSDEREIIKNELDELRKYSKRYSDLLYKLYDLLLNSTKIQNNIKYAEKQEEIDSLNTKLNEETNKIKNTREDIEHLYLENYRNLIMAIQNATKKLEQHLS